MIQTINLSDFRNAFHNMGRGEQFSYEALELMFDYYEQMEIDCGTPAELDVIATCCEIAEMTADEIQMQYAIDYDCNDEGDLERRVMEYLDNNTIIIGQTYNGIIFFQF